MATSYGRSGTRSGLFCRWRTGGARSTDGMYDEYSLVCGPGLSSVEEDHAKVTCTQELRDREKITIYVPCVTPLCTSIPIRGRNDQQVSSPHTQRRKGIPRTAATILATPPNLDHNYHTITAQAVPVTAAGAVGFTETGILCAC